MIDILKKDYDLDKKINYDNYNSYFNYPKYNTDEKISWFKDNFKENNDNLTPENISSFDKFLEGQYNKIKEYDGWDRQLISNKNEIIKFQALKLRKIF